MFQKTLANYSSEKDGAVVTCKS